MDIPYDFLARALLTLFFIMGSSLGIGQQLSDADKRLFLDAVVGRYAHYDIVAYEASLPFHTMQSLVITYGITDLYVENGFLFEKDSFCHASYRSNVPMKTYVSDAFTQAIVPRVATLDISEDDGQWTLFRPETPTLLGISLPEGEPLPSDPTTAIPRDDDRDGKPGVTVAIKLFGFYPAEMYLARRERFAYQLSVGENGRLEGVVHDRSEQLILGASHSWLTIANQPHQAADLSKSPILLVPVEPNFDCDQLMQERHLLFPKEPRARW